MHSAVVSETLAKNLITLLLVQDRKERGSRGLLSHTAMHVFDGMGSPEIAAARGTTVVGPTPESATTHNPTS